MQHTQFNPYVRYAEHRTANYTYREMMCAYDYRLFYVVDGTLRVSFKATEYTLASGALILFPPGTAYRLIFEKNAPVDYYILHFDFIQTAPRRAGCGSVPEDHFDASGIFSSECLSPFDKIFLLSATDFLAPTIAEIYSEFNRQTVEGRDLSSALMKYLLTKLILLSGTQGQKHTPDALIERIKRYISERFGEPLSLGDIAQALGYHPNYLNALFQRYEKITLHRYITQVRLNVAKERLLLSDAPIAEIALSCGFSEPSYFSKRFFEFAGMTPSDYRRSAQQAGTKGKESGGTSLE